MQFEPAVILLFNRMNISLLLLPFLRGLNELSILKVFFRNIYYALIGDTDITCVVLLKIVILNLFTIC